MGPAGKAHQQGETNSPTWLPYLYGLDVQGGSEREVQDRLVELLLYDNFPLIKQLLANRTPLIWCIRLQRAQDDAERTRIEVGLP